MTAFSVNSSDKMYRVQMDFIAWDGTRQLAIAPRR